MDAWKSCSGSNANARRLFDLLKEKDYCAQLVEKIKNEIGMNLGIISRF